MARYEIVKPAKNNEEEKKKSSRFNLLKPAPSQTTGAQMSRGAGQGILDLVGLPALATFPLERGIQKLYGQEDKAGNLPGREAELGAQFNVLDKMEQPDYQPSAYDLMMLSDNDDLMPYKGSQTGLSAVQDAQQQIPEGGAPQELTRRVVRSLPFVLGGALKEALGAEATGYLAKEAVAKMGGGEGAQTIADILGGIGYGFARSGSTVASKAPAIAEGTGILASIEKQAPGTLEKRLLSLDEATLGNLEERMNAVSQQRMSDFGAVNTRQIDDIISQANRDSILSKIHPVEQLPQQAWKQVASAAEELYNAERQGYSKLYEGVRTQSQKIHYYPSSALDVASKQLKKIANIETMPTGYGQVESLIRSTIGDLTSNGINSQELTQALRSGNTQRVEQLISNGLQSRSPITADKLMDLSIRLNDAINYEALTPSIKDLLRPLQRAVKDDFKRALGNNRPILEKAFNQAEKQYKHTAERFGKDVIGNLRRTENPEHLGSAFLNPSNLENLTKVFGKNSPQIKIAERQLVDLLSKQSSKAAKETLRQLEPFISNEAKFGAQKAIDLGDSLTSLGQKRALQTNVLEDVSKAVSNGLRPEMTLKAMRTPEGYQVVKDTFQRTKQGRELFKVLQKQTVNDLIDSITKEGRVDWNKARQILEDPGVETVMRDILGNDGVVMLKNIEKWGNNISQNLNSKKASMPTLFNKFFGELSTPAKIGLGALFGNAVGGVLGIATVGATIAAKRALAALITSQTARNSLRNLADPQVAGKALLNDANIINAAIKG